MRIAFIGLKGIPGNFTGIETYIEEIGARLADRHELWAYCRPHYAPRDQSEAFRGIKRTWLLSINTKHLDAAVHSLLSSIHASFRSFDIYHYQALGPSMFSVFPKLKGAKVVATVHGLDWARAKWGRFARFALKRAEGAMVRLADAVIVVSRALERYYRETYGLETFYIPNGVYPPKPQPPDGVLKFGVEPKSYLLFMARLTPEKGAHLLIEAFRGIDTDVKLIIAGTYQAGERWYHDRLKSLAGGDPRIVFAGWVSGELKDALLQHALAVVQPSTLEGLSIGLLEAAAAAVVCVASDIPENREILEPGGDRLGFFFRSGDAADLKRALTELLELSRVERDRLANAARDRVLAEFNWDRTAEMTDRVYRRLSRHDGYM